MIARRSFLKGAGVSLALPFLSFARKAAAQAAVPKRFIVFINGEGNLNHPLCDMWTPPAMPNNALSLQGRRMLDMLTPHQQKMVVVRGVDNALQDLYAPGNGHTGPGHTYLTAHLPSTAVDAQGQLIARSAQTPVSIGTRCMGPSLDHYLASKFGGADSLHLAVNEPSGGEYHPFSKMTREADGSCTYADMEVDPVKVFNQYIAGGTVVAPSRLDRYRAKRRNLLDVVRGSFDSLYDKVGSEDRLRLQQHAQRIADLEQTLSTVPPIQCSGLTQQLPAGFPPNGQRWGGSSGPFEEVLSTVQIDNLVTMLACGARQVMTLTHDDYSGPPMTFLATDADVPVAERSNFPVADWHARVHRDAGSAPNHPILVNGFRFYGRQFKYLLDKMDAVVEPNGKTLLDNSLVLWISEFGDGGGHNTNNLPVVLAGGLVQGNRFYDYSRTASQTVRYTTGDLLTSITKLFGYDETFGFTGAPGLNHGGLPGLI